MESQVFHTGLILLIMYDRIQVSAFTEKLRGYGYENVEACTDRKRALEKLDRVRPDVIISDAEHIGEFDGIETVRTIREQYNLPVIYLSGFHDERTFQKALDTRPAAFLSKPVNWNELRMVIESAFRHSLEKKDADSMLSSYQQMFMEMHLPCFTLNANGHFISVNKAWTELTGYSPEEITGKPFSDFVTPQITTEFKKDFEKLKKERIVFEPEIDLLGKNGNTITVSLSGMVHGDTHGRSGSIHCIMKDITEAKGLRNRLKESEERFRILFEGTQLAYHSLAIDGGIVNVNDVWCKLLGYSLEEIEGEWFGNLLVPEDQDRFRDDFSAFIRKGSVQETQYAMIRKNGSPVSVSVNGTVRYDEHGDYVQSHWIVKDVTAQKLTEDRLLQSEKKFSNLIESAGDIIYILDQDLNYLYGNGNCLGRYALTMEELTGTNYRDSHSTESVNEIIEKVGLVQKTGEPVVYEHHSMTDGNYFLRTLSPLINPETGVIESVTVISRDITRLKEIDEALLKRENEIRTITDNIPALVSYVGADRCYRFVNRQYEKWFGIPAKEIPGKNVREVLGKTAYEQKKTYIDKVLSGKQVIFDEEVGYARGGTRWVSAEYIPDLDKNGKVSGYYSLVADITMRKRVEEKLRASEERYKGLANSITDIFFAFDKDLKYTFWNKASENLTGIAEMNAIGKSLYEIFPATPEIKKAEQVYRDVIERKEARTFINEFNLGDKEYVFEIHVYPAEDGISVFTKDITESRKIEKALQESEERYRRVFEDSPVGMVLTDRNLRFLSVNPKFSNMFGYTEEELNSMTYLDITHPDHVENDRTMVENMLKGITASYRVEKRYIAKNGEILWGNLSATTIRSKEGEILYFVAMVEDITKRKEIEQNLEKMHERIDLATKSAHVGIWDWDIVNDVLVWDEEMYRLYGIRKEDFPCTYEAWLNLVHPDDRIRSDKLSKLVRKGSSDYHNEFRVIQPDGSIRYLEAIGQVLKNESEKPLRMIGINIDISEKKMAERELFESRQMLQLILDTIPSPVYWKDKDLNYLGGNRTFLDAVGMDSSEELTGKCDFDLPWSKEQADSYRKYDRNIMESGKPEFDITEPFIRFDGTNALAKTNKVPLRDAEGNIIGILGTYEDITERKIAEEALKSSEERYRVIADSSPNILLIHKDGILQYINEGGIKILGYSREEIVGKTTFQFIADSSKELVRQNMRRRDVGQEVSTYEVELITKKKEIRSFLVNAAVIPYENEQAYLIVLSDITERKRMEDELLESQTRLENAMQIARLAYWEYDVLNDVFTFDDYFYSIFRTSAEQVGGYTMSSARYAELFLYPEDMHLLEAEIRNALETTDPDYSNQVEHRMRYADGSAGYISVRYYIVKDNQGRTIRTYGANQDISDRKLTELALEERDTILSSIYENLSDIVWRIDKDTKVTYMSPSVERITGYRPDETIGQPILNFVAKEYHSAAIENIRSRIDQKGDELVFFEYEMVARNGRKIPIEVSSSAIRDEQGELVGFTGVTRDISKRKTTETELQASEARFKAFMDNLPVMTYIKNEDGKFVYGNKALLKFAGKTINQFIDTEVSDYLPAKPAKLMKLMDKKVLSTGKSVQIDEWQYFKGKSKRWFMEYKFPIITAGGEKLIGGWEMDITRRKAMESALKMSEQLYRDLVEKAGIAIMSDDAKGNITYFNREFARLFGYSMGDMKKQSMDKLLTPKDYEKAKDYRLLRMKAEHAPENYEVKGVRQDGSEIWLEVETTVLQNENKITGTRNYMWDITERKKIQKAIEDSENRFRELFKNMSSGVAVYEYDPEKKDFIFKDVNRAGMAITGIKHKREVLGKCLMECFPGVKKFGLWDVLIRVKESGRAEKFPNIHYKDGQIDLYVENFVYKLNTGEIVAVYDDIGERVLAEQSLMRSYDEIRKLSRHLEIIREEERKYIAGELHDELGQILTAVKMDVSWIRNKLSPEKKEIKKRTGSAIQIIDEAISKVQYLSTELRPRMLDDLGLLETLKAYFSEYENRTKIKIRFELPQREPEMIPGQEISVFRLIQESLTNIARHARASEVEVFIKTGKKMFELRIHDNGIGITRDKLESSESFGIMTMKERIRGWEGTFEIKGKKGAGTTINVSLPIHQI